MANWFETTLCWRCPTVYKLTDKECPHCHAANANVDWEKASQQLADDAAVARALEAAAEV